MAGYYTRKCPGADVLYINGSKRNCSEMEQCECGGRPEHGLFRGKAFVKCDRCPKATGFVSASLYNESVLRKAWNKIASIPWKEIGKGKKQ